MEYDLTTLVKNIGPIAGLLFGCFLIYKLILSEDAGKKITDQLQKSKLGIADLFLLIFAFLEGLVAANMGSDALGDTYTTRFVNHIALALAGAFAGFICIKEIIDLVNKVSKRDDKGNRVHGGLYLFIQGLQPIIYFMIAAAMPIFNLIIISKGTEDFDKLALLWGSDYSYTEIFGALQDVTARSLIMVLAHVSLTFAVAVGSIDDVKSPDKKKKVEKDKKEKGKKKLPLKESCELMSQALSGTPNAAAISVLIAKHKMSDNMRGRIVNLATQYSDNLNYLIEAKQNGNSETIAKAKEYCTKTEAKFNGVLKELKGEKNE